MRGDGFGEGVNNSVVLFCSPSQNDNWSDTQNSPQVRRKRQDVNLLFIKNSFT
jgi:hypothetical protein